MAKKIICFGLLFFLTACYPKNFRDTFVSAGTFVTVISPCPRAAAIVKQEFDRLDKLFNPFRCDSELFLLNQSQGLSLKLSSELCSLLQTAKDIFVLTGGRFDPAQGTLFLRWKKFLKNEASFPLDRELKKIIVSKGMDAVLIDRENNTVTITEPGLHLDLSGIAKGYMVDSAAARLKEAGIDSALIDAGGDIYCLGLNKGNSWKIGLRHPGQKKNTVKEIALSGSGIATSGNYEQFTDYQGRRYSHLIDPRSGNALESGILSITVVAVSSAAADAWATAFFFMDKEEMKNFLATDSDILKIYVISKDKGGIKTDVFQP